MIMVCMDKLEMQIIGIVKKLIEKKVFCGKERKEGKSTTVFINPTSYPIQSIKKTCPTTRSKENLDFHPKENRQLIADIFRMTHGYIMTGPFDGYQFFLRASR